MVNASFLAKMKRLRSTRQYSDFTVYCQDEEFKVHRSVITCQSQYFDKMCGGGWKEAIEGKVHLEDDDASVVAAMFQYMYDFDYDSSDTAQNNSDNDMEFHIAVHTIADKYEVPGLAGKATEKFLRAARPVLDRIRDEAGAVHELVSAIRSIYDSTPATNRQLRNAVVDLLVQDPAAFRHLAQDRTFQTLLGGVARFGGDVATALNCLTLAATFQCATCRFQFVCVPSPSHRFDALYCPGCGGFDALPFAEEGS